MTPAAKLLRWFKAHGRALPWRQTTDPYKILVSEIMLQQTQVPRVLLFYGRWLTRFPNWGRLAKASNAEVILQWAGLGYNRRALMLRDIARQVAALGVPKTETAWRELRGIGPYTASALAIFSLHERRMPIDTNIRRVLARFELGIPFPLDQSNDQKLSQTSLLPHRGKFYDVPQALFDLATLICKKEPTCAVCPLRGECKAAAKFLSDRIRVPKAMIKKAREKKHRDKKFPDRIYRGRILKLVRESKGGVPMKNVGSSIDANFVIPLDQNWLEAMVNRLTTDGLIEIKRGRLTLVE